MKRIQKIVVATDFSGVAEHALDTALDLAEQLGATIALIHAYEIPIYGFPDGILVAPSDVAAAIATNGQAGLSGAIAKHKARGVEITPFLRCGPPWDEINSIVAELGADLVVVGTHGRRGLARALLGSVAERILRTATCPVLVVHAEAQETGAASSARTG